jgi:riboflavin synthase
VRGRPSGAALFVLSSLSSMFTGIVQQLGRVASFEGGRLVVESGGVRAAVGDSVAVNGVCLTVVGAPDGRLEFDVVQETLERAKPFGDEVNLEGALRAGEPLGGHYVQGHVDGVGTVRSKGDPVWIDVPADLLPYIVDKGSIAVDGISLTVAALDEQGFAVALIPHTLEVTTLGKTEPGDAVNLEVDILAKYVERLLRSKP